MGPESLVLVVERKGKEKKREIYWRFLITIAFLFDRGDVRKKKLNLIINPWGFFPVDPGSRGS